MDRRNWLKRAAVSFTVASFALSGLFSPVAISGEKLKWAHVYETSTPYHKWAEWAAEQIGKRSNGKYEVQVFPAASLGKENEINESLSLGTIDIIYTGSTFVGRSYGPLAIPSAPFMLRDFDHFNAYASSPLFSELSDGYRSVTGHNIQSLTYYGQRMVTSNKPVYKPADMKDMKLRVPPAPLFQMFTDSVEANATPIAFSEVYLALSQGVVDGQENPLPTIKAKKFYEVQKYINLTGHIIDSLVTVVGGPTWNKLSDSDRAMFKEVFVEAAAGASNDIQKSEKELVAWFVAQGVNINTEIDRKAFRKAAMTVHNGKHASWSEDVYKRFQEL
ncbi:putative TRAP-type C4-dicarboxylate transport system, periplasmic component [Vibrio nigripulchritudo MADA3029]|uniref:Putative TRAP-type C4-dicarboxylate transport system, periplasmic component n=1 Tax=Vibrio nigripulchritudo TaxID=28173 RepID=U4KBM1_9VIBR|nr:sialic acid TRAP transporter substrate-binding protein SiaP [Vibrio nigripulchritudo]EGU57957.1 TRAP dicarboxylate transporter DctP subunit [Vibrio nigripulchritudo ATCC 27043]KJY73715.1 ABC transporter substrate-binding protein [Vibrio nigripulchritudo]CCN46573.1 putative TRAP-type C4-dicarboxylate transport system, periplasmic component [Vibrio nigripulchritudo MADA3020]CCN54650.1 putative TRAP-type C4-dicarboxylate transport system, periplasmic component [Vibrio nigripulchritudo MADA3021]